MIARVAWLYGDKGALAGGGEPGIGSELALNVNAGVIDTVTRGDERERSIHWGRAF